MCENFHKLYKQIIQHEAKNQYKPILARSHFFFEVSNGIDGIQKLFQENTLYEPHI